MNLVVAINGKPKRIYLAEATPTRFQPSSHRDNNQIIAIVKAGQ